MSWASAIVVVATLVPMPTASLWAQTQQPARSNTLTLSDEQKAELLNQDTEESVAAARAGSASELSSESTMHGEVGAMIGSRGTRAAYGAATIPFGENSQASVSFERSHSDVIR